ncbi:Pentatricopeptide repeat [Dillenia turbinata]|uniref:Pentatricopeptide repeat n=1 Tax=Dillenia turbinata TaxID=194707 RepID=A0AAN8Z4R0_9MAGN
MVLITHQALASPSIIQFLTLNPHSNALRPPIYPLRSFKIIKLFSLSSTSSPLPHSSTTHIFLPHLQEEEEETKQQQQQQQKKNSKKQHDPEEDPLLKFFKDQTSTQDPQCEGKLQLQKNRKTSWHLLDGNYEDFPEESDFDDENVFKEEKEQVGLSSNEESEGLVGDMLENLTVGELLGSNFVKKDDFKDENGFNGENKQVGLSSNQELGVVGEILRMARTVPENMTIGELLGSYEGKIGEKDCWEVLELMGEEGLVIDCLYFFEWMGLQEPSLVTPRACTVLFPILGKAGLGDKLMILFQNLPAKKQFRDVHVYNAAISGLLSCGRHNDAWKVYEAMETNNVQPDYVTCSIMITIMRKEGRSAKDVWEFFERMNRKGVEWSVEVLGALIKSFCDEGLKKEALTIQTEMEKKGISSNVIVYNTLMDAYCKSNQIEEVEGLFAEMKIKGIVPTSATFNILMDAYSRRMQPEIIEKLMVEIQDIGLEPNVKSYTCLISAYGRQKKMSDMAADAFLKMKKAGIKPTSHSYTALIHAYAVDGWHEKAYIAFESMQRERIKPSIETFTALLDAFRRAGDTQTLKKIWKLMINEKIEGTRVTFNILLDGFAKQGHYIEARDVISEFGKIGLQPTVMTYNMLINAYARGGQHLKLPQLLKEMSALNIKPDSITYSTMIYAFVRVRDFNRAFFYHKKMIKSGQVPDAKSYQKLRAILDVKAATKNRRDKSALLGIINSSAGLLKTKRQGKKDEFWKNKKKVSRTRNLSRIEK